MSYVLLPAFVVFGLLLSAALHAVAGGTRSKPFPNKPSPSKTSPPTHRVIILLDAPSVLDLRRQMAGPTAPEGLRPLSQEEQTLLLAQVKRLKAAQERVIARLQAQHLILTVHRRYLHLLNGFAATVPAKKFKALAATPGIRAVYPDHRVHATLDESVPLIGAPTLWAMTDPQGRPVRGQGIRVAVIDTGIDYTHPDLGGCFGPGCKVAGGYDFVNNDPDPWDDNGHGTHVAGIIAANGSVTGVAPEATLYAYKVLDASGSGWDSDLIAALERAVDPDGNPTTDDGVHVINLSLGGPGNPDDPLSQAVDAAVDAGAVVVAAAGNSGDKYFTVESPGNARKALTVGASTKTDEVAVLSSRGPVYWGWLLKPDLLAPGMAIRSTVPGGGYEAWNGTSMATPHVAGGAALLRQLHPDWSPERVKAMLMNTAQDLSVSALLQGAGRVFLPAAAAPWVIVEPASLSLGMVDEGSPVWERTVPFTVTNPTAQSASYTLHLPTSFPPGVTASLSASRLNVGPGGAGQVSLTLRVDNSLFTPPGPSTYTVESEVLVMDGGRSLRVPVIFGVSPPSDAYEPDNRPDQATPISTDGTPQTHDFHVPGDEDWMRFAATAGTWYAIETSNHHFAGDTVLHLYDVDGATELAYDDDSGVGWASLILWQAPKTGTYFIRVRHHNPNAMGPDTMYDVWVKVLQPDPYEPNDDPSQATPIDTNGTHQTHNFYLPGDEDWLIFTTTGGVTYTIETGNLGFKGDTVLHLYDVDASTELARDDDSGGNFASRIVWTAPKSGSYYIRVHHYDSDIYGEDTQYDIWVQDTVDNGCGLAHDFDNDGAVSVDDLAMVVSHWRERRQDPTWDDRLDDDSDGRITVKDILAASTQLGVKCSELWYELRVDIAPYYARGLGQVYRYPPPNDEGKYQAGTRVYLHAWPDRDYECYDTPYWRFVRWGGALSGSKSRGVVIMNGDQWVVAYFREMFPPPCTSRP